MRLERFEEVDLDGAAERAMTVEQREKHERGQLRDRYSRYGELVFPGEAIAPILNVPVREALHAWMIEMSSATALKRVGLQPRSRALLSGPPGCGKTTLAHHVTARMGLPMLVIQSTEVISKYVGATGETIGKLFREARRDKGKVALFFDEFDSTAHKRKDAASSAATEQNNVVIALLQEIDRFDGMLFAATNRAADIDPAIWRRFQLQIEIGFPGRIERFAIVKLYLSPFEAEDETVEALAAAFDGASPALIKEGCETIKRSLVLGDKLRLATDLPAILGRLASASAPAEGMPTPTLWGEYADIEDLVSAAPWPPVLKEETKP
jgi:MoxR-like ATPase